MTALQAPLPRMMQAKLAIGQMNDPLEHEADHVADAVMSMPDPSLPITIAAPRISRKCDACEEESQPLQTKTIESSVAPSRGETGIVEEVLRTPGQPLGLESRAFFAPRFGRDFSQVRVHSDAQAAASAQSIGALAYTAGQHIVFQTGQYAPGTQSGGRLLAHELAHVVQQGGAGEGRPAGSFLSGDRIQRQPAGAPPPPPPFAVTQQDMVYLQNTMLQFYELIGPEGRASLQRNTTVVIALVTEANEPHLVYTVASNSTSPRIREAAEQLGLTRWDPEGIDTVAGEHHAEQLTVEAAEKLDFQVHGIAVSRTPCADCAPRIAELGIPLVFVPDPFPRAPRGPDAPGTPPAGGTPPPGPDPTADPGKEPKGEVGEPLAPVAEHGPAAGGTAAMESGPIALQIIGSVLNHFADKHQAALANEALKPYLGAISQELSSHPDEGVLVVNEYEQTEAGEASVVQPGGQFLQPRIAYGRTRDEARGKLAPSYAPATTGEGMRPISDEVWYQPKHADAAGYAYPFPDIAIARFKPGREQLRHIRWQAGALSDKGATGLPSPAKWDWTPSFHVLRLPEALAWTEPGGRHGTTMLSLKTEMTANNFAVPTGAGAVPVFAVDENTFQLFQLANDAKTLDDDGELRYINIDYMRWARAEDIEIIKVLSHEDVTASIPAIAKSEAEKVLADAPAPVRALYETLTKTGDTTTKEDVIERFLAVVPSDLTMDEVGQLTARLGKAKNTSTFFSSLAAAITKLRARSEGEGMAPGGGLDFRKSTGPGYTPAGLTGQIGALLDSVRWNEVSSGPTYFDNVIGKVGNVETFAYGIDDQGRHWGALVTVSVGKKEREITPVTVRGSTALVSEQGQAIYGNSLLWGRTFRLSPEQGGGSP